MPIKLKSQNFISKKFFSLWLLLILISLFLMKDDLLNILLFKKRYVRLIELLIIMAIFCEGLFFKYIFHHWTVRRKAVTLFIIALIVRLIFLPSGKYVPSSDFSNYYLGACHFVNTGFSGGAYPGLEGYDIPSFALQAIINGFFLNILSPTLLGMQLLNSIYTAGICLMLFLLGKNINEKAAITASIFYTFYPCSILSTQITSNHHGAAFFILLGIYLFFAEFKYKKTFKKFVYLLTSAVCLVISNYYHPSVIIVLCAFGTYMFIYELEKYICHPKSFFKSLLQDVKNFDGIFLPIIVLFAFYLCIWTSTMTALKNSGYIQNTSTMSFLSKITVGFNFETGGAYSKDDYAYVRSFPAEEQNKESIRLVQKRIKENGITNTIKLLLQKNQGAWFGTDNYFFFYQAGIHNELTEKIENMDNPILKANYENELTAIKYFITDISVANSLFNYFIWFLAFIGIIAVLRKYNSNHPIYLLMYIPFGWMLFIMISEMQPRYRYQGMTVIILAAGIGFETLRNWFVHLERKKNDYSRYFFA